MVQSKVRRQEGVIEPVRTLLVPIGIFFHGNSAREYFLVLSQLPKRQRVGEFYLGCNHSHHSKCSLWLGEAARSAQSLFVPQVVIISVRLFHIVHSIPFVCLQVFPFPHEIIKIVWPLTKWRRNGGMLTHSHQVHDGQGSPARSSSGLFITDSHSKLDRKLNSQWHICCLFWHLWRSLPQ